MIRCNKKRAISVREYYFCPCKCKQQCFMKFSFLSSYVKNLPKKMALIAFLAFVIMLGACNSGEKIPDVSNIAVKLDTRRLDRDLIALDTNKLGQGLQSLQQKYPDFLDFYLDVLMGFGIKGNFSDTSQVIQNSLKVFLTYKDYKGLFDTVNKHFPDTKQIDEDLTKGFKYMKYYYKDFKEPKIVYFITGLNDVRAVPDGGVLGIGLDMYLGPQYPHYLSVGIPDYMTHKLQPQYACVYAMSAIYFDMHPFEKEGRNLLDMMIQRGKQQYFLHKVLPFADDTLRFGYTKKQMDWCDQNEALVYNFFIKDNLLYETNWQKVIRYVSDGPNSTGMPAESPGDIGAWLGYRIVQAYMEQHPEKTMPELFAFADAQKILQESKYKPK